MGVQFVTGSAYQLRMHLQEDMHSALAGESGEGIILVVPGQLTLDAERLALQSVDRPGSFRLQVFSPRRLCDKILEQAGRSMGSRIDENGRVMLMRRALDSLDKPLRAYERARRSNGFALLASDVITQWKESGMDAEGIDKIAAEHADTPLGDKLSDIATLYRAWHACAQGLGIDDEDARRLAMSRVDQAPYFRGTRVWFYGFDLLTHPIAQSILALAKVCAEVRVLLSLQDTVRDSRLYDPIRKTYEYTLSLLRADGIPYTRERAKVQERTENAVRHLERELFCFPVHARSGEIRELRLYAARNPRDEAEHIAASVRQMVRRQNLRYSDICIACQDASSMFSALRRAFSLYDIPIFFPESRTASSHPLCASLLAALQIAAGPVREGDVQTLLSLGYSGLTDDEADLLRNFAFTHGITARKWRRVYQRGADPEGTNAAFEELRSRCFDPVERLAKGMRRGTTRDRLESVFRYLQETNAYAHLLEQADALNNANEAVYAAEGMQVWSRITACLDQIAILYGNAKRPPSAAALNQMMQQALSVVELNPLPQSADAIAAGKLEHMKAMPVRLLIICGATDAEDSENADLLSDAERRAIEKQVWLGPNHAEQTRMRMLAAKSAVSFTGELLWISWHVSGSDGSVRRPGALVRSIQAVFPEQGIGGSVNENARELGLRLLHPNAALYKIGETLRREEGQTAMERETLEALSRLPRAQKQLAAMRVALLGDVLPESIPSKVASRLYDGPKRLSVTRLERFARCPFSHFLQYGARPEEIREYGITPRDSGDFCHMALSRFTELYPNEVDIETALRHMDTVTSELLEERLLNVAQDGAVNEREVQQLRATARRAAAIHLRQMGVSRFSPAAVETAFRGNTAVRIGDAQLEGRIDRVDLWKAANETYLRIIDYKRGGKAIKFSQIYYGLQLQLLIYLVAAGAMFDAQLAGALYFNVSDPLIRTDDTDPAAIEKSREKELRLDGMILEDEQVVQAMSSPPEVALPVYIKADGTFRKSDKLIAREDFALLTEHALACAMQDLAQIRAGVIGVHPVSLDNDVPCSYCSFSAICRRDSYTASARERRLRPMNAEDVLDALHKEK